MNDEWIYEGLDGHKIDFDCNLGGWLAKWIRFPNIELFDVLESQIDEINVKAYYTLASRIGLTIPMGCLYV